MFKLEMCNTHFVCPTGYIEYIVSWLEKVLLSGKKTKNKHLSILLSGVALGVACRSQTWPQAAKHLPSDKIISRRFHTDLDNLSIPDACNNYFCIRSTTSMILWYTPTFYDRQLAVIKGNFGRKSDHAALSTPFVTSGQFVRCRENQNIIIAHFLKLTYIIS